MNDITSYYDNHVRYCDCQLTEAEQKMLARYDTIRYNNDGKYVSDNVKADYSIYQMGGKPKLTREIKLERKRERGRARYRRLHQDTPAIREREYSDSAYSILIEEGLKFTSELGMKSFRRGFVDAKKLLEISKGKSIVDAITHLQNDFRATRQAVLKRYDLLSSYELGYNKALQL
ncbi:MAG: hypothetical protein HUJ96_04580 [Marinilabiliaceae bacterium]|nr:hypothetical protein [Marinilabiliaceae bacterium]